MPLPLISIITINRNNAVGLRRTLASTAEQSCANFEHVVIDGASSDESLAVIQEFRDRLTYAVSERDSGIYNAMNKGIAVAKGKYLLFLNSGDHLLSDTSLATAANWLTSAEIVYFNAQLVRPNTGATSHTAFPAKLSFSFFARQSLAHPATFIDVDLFKRFGLYDESLQIVSDWKAFLIWVCRHSCSYSAAPEVLSVHYLDGISNNPTSMPILQSERERTLQQEFSAFYQDYRDARYSSEKLTDLRNNTLLKLLQRAKLLSEF